MVLIYETSTFFLSSSGIPQNLFLSGRGRLSISLIIGAIPLSMREFWPLDTTPGIVFGSLFSTKAKTASSPSLCILKSTDVNVFKILLSIF